MIDPGAAARAISDSLRRGASAPQPGAPGDRGPTPAKPSPYPDEPLPGFDGPSPAETGEAWRIARAVALKECNSQATGGFLPALAEVWGLPKDADIKAVARVMARFLVTGE